MDWSLLALKIIICGLFIVLTTIGVLLIVLIQRTLTIENKRVHTIKVRNQGNFTSIFNLSVLSVEKMFDFKILYKNIPLMAVSQNQASQLIPVDPKISPYVPPMQNKTNKKTGSSMMNEAVRGEKVVAAKAGQTASLLSALASLLPGSIGSSLRARSQLLRETQTNLGRAAQMPQKAQRKADAFRQQGGRLASTSTAAVGNPIRVRQSALQGPVDSQAEPSGSIAVNRAAPDVYTVQTQPVEPGETLSLKLQIQASKGSRPEGTFTYTLKSEQIPVEAVDGERSSVTQQGVVFYPHHSAWRYWLSPVATFLVIVISLSALIISLRFIW